MGAACSNPNFSMAFNSSGERSNSENNFVITSSCARRIAQEQKETADILLVMDPLAFNTLRELLTQSRMQSFLTRLAGNFTVKYPATKFPRLTWTALDLGGPCVETFGRIHEMAHL